MGAVACCAGPSVTDLQNVDISSALGPFVASTLKFSFVMCHVGAFEG